MVYQVVCNHTEELPSMAAHMQSIAITKVANRPAHRTHIYVKIYPKRPSKQQAPCLAALVLETRT